MKRFLCLCSVFIAIAILPSMPAVAQGGYFGVGTISYRVFNSVTASGAQTVLVPNIGQSSHWLTLCVSGGTVNSLQIQLEASFDGINWFAITEQANPTANSVLFQGCQILEASGYFAEERVNLVAFGQGGGGGALSAWYSATQTAISSDGLMKTGKSSQPVTFVPSVSFSNTNIKSTPVSIATSVSSVYQLSFFNANASPVFCLIFPGFNTAGVSGINLTFGVAANSSRDISFPNGIQLGASSVVECGTAVNGAGDPATGIIVQVHLKGFGSSTSGASQTQPTIPN